MIILTSSLEACVMQYYLKTLLEEIPMVVIVPSTHSSCLRSLYSLVSPTKTSCGTIKTVRKQTFYIFRGKDGDGALIEQKLYAPLSTHPEGPNTVLSNSAITNKLQSSSCFVFNLVCGDWVCLICCFYLVSNKISIFFTAYPTLDSIASLFLYPV